jgi:hypothetical protein
MTARNHFYSTSLSLSLAGWLMALDARAKIIIYTVSAQLCMHIKLRAGVLICVCN